MNNNDEQLFGNLSITAYPDGNEGMALSIFEAPCNEFLNTGGNFDNTCHNFTEESGAVADKDYPAAKQGAASVTDAQPQKIDEAATPYKAPIENIQSGNTDTVGGNEREQVADKESKSKYGKFKNPQELLKAYGELEKEFTRRSQRLKELEDGMAPFKSEKEWRGAVDKFFKETPSARAFAKEIAGEIIAHPELKQSRNCFNIALTHVLIDKFRTPEQLMSDGQFLKEYVLSSPVVKNAVIAEYLGSLRDGQPPHTMANGGMQIVAPAKRPGTIEEAGLMFLKNNK